MDLNGTRTCEGWSEIRVRALPVGSVAGANVDPDSQGEDCSSCDKFDLWGEGKERHSIEEHSHEKCAEEDAWNRTSPPAETDSSDDAGGDGVEFHQFADRGCGGA